MSNTKDYQPMINDLLPGKSLQDKYERLVKSKAKVKKIPFSDSAIYDKTEFAKAFPTWGPVKWKHYWESADSYSEEGNRYVNWVKAIANWASKDDATGRFKWTAVSESTGNKDNNNKMNGLVM